MSLQWNFIAGYLYFEMGLIILMVLPIFSPRTWFRLYRSRFIEAFHSKAAIYFYGWSGILCLFLFDSIREMRKYSHSTDAGHVHLSSEMKGNVKLFRAQRNFYITGFAIFLVFVIRKMAQLIIVQYDLEMKMRDLAGNMEQAMATAELTITNISIESKKALAVAKTAENQLDLTVDALKAQKCRTKELEAEVTMWRQKYEQVTNGNDKEGQGDN
ncbi:B-cell receptor-associated protein 31-like [Bicyclus anynana]|uniref:Endoplasmic reticulum transmembrane protein n=1 Tax=Bicyclus anynana TaxID=110368 RepID=A0A6J1MUP5_BICAN|nr:B-cell receptor-associated protein 31-like [Bicyclus anynana]